MKIETTIRLTKFSSVVHTELLYIYEKDLSDELRKSLHTLCEDIRTSMKRFDHYFGHFTEHQVICAFKDLDKKKNVQAVLNTFTFYR